MRPTHRFLAAIGCVAALAATACTAATDSTRPAASTPDSRPSTPEPAKSLTSTELPADAEPLPEMVSSPQDVSTQLGAPWSVAFYKGIALVSERDSGRILELAEDGSSREVTVVEESAARGEGGLLGLAVDDEDRLFVYYTARKDNRIARFDIAGAAGSLSLGEPTIILEGLSKATTHNGGRIAFGPDGMLYAATGDAGKPGRSQDIRSLSGKILRMTPEGDVPPDNPLANSLVWTWGHRNVQGMAWTDDGTMFATEFGQNTWDELNLIESGKNYGWPTVEGKAGNADFVDPVQQWAPKNASPSGMAYLDGELWITNLRGQSLRSVPVSDLTASNIHWEGDYGRLRDVVVSPDGHLWVITNNTDGRGNPGEEDDRILAISAEALTE